MHQFNTVYLDVFRNVTLHHVLHLIGLTIAARVQKNAESTTCPCLIGHGLQAHPPPPLQLTRTNFYTKHEMKC